MITDPLLVAAEALDPANRAVDHDEVSDDWEAWLRGMFPGHVSDTAGTPVPFGEHHSDFWEWVWNIEKGSRSRPFVAVWPRGGAKSTSAELACAALACRRARRYALYVCETQDQADTHVANIAAMLESRSIEDRYPAVGRRRLSKYGTSRGWRHNRLRTDSGFTIDAIGLDSAARGAKIDEDRPDLIILDDVDSEGDSLASVEKKIDAIVKKLLPAGSDDLVVLAIQNLIHDKGVFARLANIDPDHVADFLADRIVSGPHPAIRDAAFEQRAGRWVIVAGTPVWAGMGLQRCQEMVDTMGVTAFRSECQHEVSDPPGGLFSHLEYRHCTSEEVPDLVRVVVWVDPAVTDTDQSDSHGIQADGIAEDGTIYRLWSYEQRGTPLDTLRRAILKAHELSAEAVGIETDQGGDTWESNFREAYQSLRDDEQLERHDRLLPMRSAKASAQRKHDSGRPVMEGSGETGSSTQSKTARANKMLADYERGRIVHVIGTHATLERALNRFPRKKPYDLTDAAYWAWADLRGRSIYATAGFEALNRRFRKEPGMGFGLVQGPGRYRFG